MNPRARTIAELQVLRQLRALSLPDGLFGEPSWDMLLELSAQRLNYRAIPVVSLGIASHAPQTTALRHIDQLEHAGLIETFRNRGDRRSRLVRLSDGGAAKMDNFFQRIEARHA